MISEYTQSLCAAQHIFPVNAEVISFVNQLTTLSRRPFGVDSTFPGCLWQETCQQQTFRTEQGSPITYAMMNVPPERMVRDTTSMLGIQSNEYAHKCFFVTIFTTGLFLALQ